MSVVTPPETGPDVIVFDSHRLHARPLPASPPLLAPVLEPGSLMLIRGEAGLGKSWLALTIAHAVASGSPALGWRAPSAARVFHVDGALRLPVLQRRSRAVAAGLAQSAPPGFLQFRLGSAQPLPDLGSPEGLARMATLLPSDVALVVLDNVIGFLPAARGIGARLLRFADWIDSLRRRNIAVVLTDGPRRAATAVLDERADLVLALARPPDYLPDEGARLRVRFAVARGLTGPDVRRFEARLAVSDGRASWTRIDAFDEEALEAWRLHQEGQPMRRIAGRMDVSLATVSRLVAYAARLPPALRGGPPDPPPSTPAAPSAGGTGTDPVPAPAAVAAAPAVAILAESVKHAEPVGEIAPPARFDELPLDRLLAIQQARRRAPPNAPPADGLTDMGDAELHYAIRARFGARAVNRALAAASGGPDRRPP